jgi:NAD(P)-dependent dehydrogenase (short-subunit alcohol dehydrogenase family)
MKLEGKVALITGAGSGMGKATAFLFAREGAKIAAVDVNQESVAETAAEIERNGGQAIAIRADVSTEADASQMVEATRRGFGTPGVLFNNAGIEGESAFVGKMTAEAFDRVIAINLRGVFLGMKYVLPHMVDAGGGSIINQAVDRRVGRDAGWSGVLRSQGRSDSNDARRGA